MTSLPRLGRWALALCIATSTLLADLPRLSAPLPGINQAEARRRRRIPRARRRIARKLQHYGLRQMSLGQYAKAVKSFRSSYRFWPWSRTLFLWGQSLELGGALKPAAKLYERLLKRKARGVDRKVIEKRLELVKRQLAAQKDPPDKPHVPEFTKPDKPDKPDKPEVIEDDGTESLEDPEDESTDDTDDWKPGLKKQGDTKAATQAELPVRWGASALLRFGLDTAHEAGGQNPVPEDAQELYGQATASIQYRPKDWIRLKLSGQLIYRLTLSQGPGDDGFFGGVNRNEIEPRLQQTFVEFSTSWLDVAAGMMTTTWGVNDLINPNDVLSAKDLRSGPPVDPEAIRFPTPTVKAELYLGPLTLSALWNPLFLPHKVDLFGSDFALFGPGGSPVFASFGALLGALVDNSLEGQAQPLLLSTTAPRPVRDSAGALRVALSAGGWDVAAQYAYTLTPQPIYRIDRQFMLAVLPMMTPGYQPSPTDLQLVGSLLSVTKGRPIEATHDHFHQVGLSVSTALWKLVASLDVGFRVGVPLWLSGPALDADGSAIVTSVPSDVVSATLGLRYSYGDELLVSLESWYELQTGVLELAEAHRPALLFGGPHRAGIALLARYVWASVGLTFEVTALTELANTGYVIAPQIAYRVGDHLRIFAGANIFGGEAGSTGGTYDPNDQVFVGLQGYL